MKQKNTMKVWQFIVTECLLVAMLITMFLPVFNINGKVVEKMMKSAVESTGLDALGIAEDLLEAEIQKMADSFDEEIKKHEEEYNTKISSISPLNIMTKSFIDIMLGDKAQEEDIAEEFKEDEAMAAVEAGWSTIKICLWIVYVLVIIMLIVNIVGFCAKFSKYIALSLDVVVGLIAAIFFCILRFAASGMLAASGEGADMLGLGIAVDMGDMIGALYGVPFTIIAIGGSIIFLLCSIVFMFVGKPAAKVSASHAYDEIPTPAAPKPVAAPTPAPTPVVVPEPIPVPAPTPVAAPTPAPAQAAQPAMGQVRVVKGIANGQGFSLPQDRKVVVGKNPQKANLVISDQHISNIHCSIRYNAANNSYIIKDHSSNGTFVNGVRLQKDMAMEYPAGTLLCLADGSNEILLG